MTCQVAVYKPLFYIFFVVVDSVIVKFFFSSWLIINFNKNVKIEKYTHSHYLHNLLMLGNVCNTSQMHQIKTKEISFSPNFLIPIQSCIKFQNILFLFDV